MATISATVFGGKAPIPIKVIIDNLDNANDHTFSSPGTFTQSFNLPKGRYKIVVTGANANTKNAYTEIDLTGDFEVGPLQDGHREPNDPFYFEIFYVEV